MPEFEVTSPDGKRFSVTAPEGATQEQVLGYAKQQFSASPVTAPANDASNVPASVISAYQNDQMTRDEKIQFEKDAKEGLVKLPTGMKLGQTEPLGFVGRIKEQFTGSDRQTPSVADNLPDWNEIPEFQGIDMPSFKAALGTMTGSPAEIAQIMKANYPQIGVKQDEKGNYILTSAVDGKDYPIKPGFQASDAPRAAFLGAAFTPAGRMESIGGGILANAGTQAAIEASQAATGGNFDAGNVATAGVIGGAIPAAGALVSPAKTVINKVLGRVAPAAEEQVAPVVAATETAAPVTQQVAPQAAPLSVDELGATARSAALGGLGSKKATQELAAQASPDAELTASAKRLGVQDYLQPDHVTTNHAYRQLAQLVKSQTGSTAAMAQREGLEKFAGRANEIVDEIAGKVEAGDVSTLSENVAKRMNESNLQLKAKANKLYEEVDTGIGKNMPVEATNIIALIRANAEDLGGLKNVSSAEQNLLKKLTPQGKNKPTYALLDKLRKDIGAAKRGKQNEFGSSNEYELGRLEAALRADQKAVADGAGFGEKWELAQATSQMYKGVQDDLTAIYGKELDKSMAPMLKGAITKMKDGDTSTFIKLLKSTPEDMRREVVAGGLASFFRRTAKGGEMDFSGYANWFDGLKSQPTAYAALMSNLPKGAPQQLADIAKLSRGIATAKGEFIATGKALNPKALEQADGVIGKIFDEVKRRGVSGMMAEVVGSSAGAPGLATAIQSATMGAKPSIMQAADKLIVSQEFVDAIKAAGTPNAQAAVKKLSNSEKFKAFYRFVNKSQNPSEREKWLNKIMQIENQNQQEKK